MNNAIFIIVAISIAIGMLCGAVVVWLIYLRRGREVVDSLIRVNHVVGRAAMVEIPFDSYSQGKVRMNVKGSLVDFTAFTDEEKQFQPGEMVLVVGMKGNKVWVVSMNNEE